MIDLQEFKISNLSGSNITIESLDNFVLLSGAVDVDMFDAANGNFTVADVQENEEIEQLLQQGSISAKDQNDGVFQTVFRLYGHMYTVIEATPPNTTQDDFNPTGWYNAKVVNVITTAAQFFTGFAATYHGDFKILRNESNSTLSLLFNNANSIAQNRIYPTERTTNNNKKYSAVVIHYCGQEERWKTIDAEKP